MRSVLALAMLPLLATSSPVLNVGTIDNGVAPLLTSSNAEEVPNSYIVVFKDHVNERAAAAHHDWVQNLHVTNQATNLELRKRDQSFLAGDVTKGLKHIYNIVGSFYGYSGHFDDSVIDSVRRHPDVS